MLRCWRKPFEQMGLSIELLRESREKHHARTYIEGCAIIRKEDATVTVTIRSTFRVGKPRWNDHYFQLWWSLFPLKNRNLAAIVERTLLASGAKTGNPFSCKALYNCHASLTGKWPHILQARSMTVKESSTVFAELDTRTACVNGNVRRRLLSVNMFTGIAASTEVSEFTCYIGIDYKFGYMREHLRTHKSLIRIIHKAILDEGATRIEYGRLN